MNGLCVGRPGLKSSCKENSWGRGEPVAQEPALRPAAAPQHTDGGCAAVVLPTSNCSPSNTRGALELTLEEAGPTCCH